MWTVRTKVHRTGKQGHPAYYYNEFKTKRQAELFARKCRPTLREQGFTVSGVLVTNMKIGPSK